MATIKDLLSNKTISRELCSQLDVADNHQCVTRLTQHYIELELIHHKDPKYFDKYYNSDGKTGNRFIDVLIRCKNRLTLKAFHDCAVEKERHDICDLLPDLPDILCDLLPEIPADQLLRNVRPSVLKDIGEKLTPTPGILVANWEEFAEHFKLKETQINEIKTSRVNTVTNSPAKELLECLSLESPKTLVSDIVSHFRKYYFNSIADFLQEHLDKGNIRKLPLICESESFACVSFHEVHGNSNFPAQKKEFAGSHEACSRCVPLSVIQYRGDGNSTNSDDGRSGDEFSDNEFDEEDSSNSCSQIQDGNSISSMEITKHQETTPTEKQLLPPSTSPSSFVGASNIAPGDERIAEEDKSIAQNTHDNKNTYESSSDCRPGVKTSDVKDKSSCRHCVIISNTSCLKNGKWKTKSQKMSKATENDLNKLQNLLQSNEFCIIHHSNLSSQAMEKTFQEQSQCNHSAYDGFLGIILTWGEGDVIFGCDNVPFNLTATVKRFGDVESLKGKPIIFIVRSLEKSKMFARDNVQPTTIKKSNDSTLIYHGKCYGSNGYHEDGTSCFVEGLYPMLNIDNLDMRLMHGILSENNFPVVEGKRKGFFKGPLSLFMG